MSKIPPLFDRLPRLEEADLALLCEVSRYDGPISGLIRHLPSQALYGFDWWHVARECEDEDDDGGKDEREIMQALGFDWGRLFLLRPVPVLEQGAVEAWVSRHEALGDEFQLVANPHVWPVSDWQRAQLRPLDLIQRDWQQHDEARPRWESQPATAWFVATGEAFAALQTFTLTADESAAFERWQHAVAAALGAQDQPALDRLFEHPPGPCMPEDLYCVRLPQGPVVRDGRGQPLPPDFWMTARHRVQDFSALLSQPAAPSCSD